MRSQIKEIHGSCICELWRELHDTCFDNHSCESISLLLRAAIHMIELLLISSERVHATNYPWVSIDADWSTEKNISERIEWDVRNIWVIIINKTKPKWYNNYTNLKRLNFIHQRGREHIFSGVHSHSRNTCKSDTSQTRDAHSTPVLCLGLHPW